VRALVRAVLGDSPGGKGKGTRARHRKACPAPITPLAFSPLCSPRKGGGGKMTPEPTEILALVVRAFPEPPPSAVDFHRRGGGKKGGEGRDRRRRVCGQRRGPARPAAATLPPRPPPLRPG